MPLNPTSDLHALQIDAGTIGRKSGHAFEIELASRLNSVPMPFIPQVSRPNLLVGDPAIILLCKIAKENGFGLCPPSVPSPQVCWQPAKKVESG